MSGRYRDKRRQSRSRSKSWSDERSRKNRDKHQQKQRIRVRQRNHSSRQNDRVRGPDRDRHRQRSNGRDREINRRDKSISPRKISRERRDYQYRRREEDRKIGSKEIGISIGWTHKRQDKYKDSKRERRRSNSYSRSESSSSSSSSSSSYSSDSDSIKKRIRRQRASRGSRDSRRRSPDRSKYRSRSHSSTERKRRATTKKFEVEKRKDYINSYKDSNRAYVGKKYRDDAIKTNQITTQVKKQGNITLIISKYPQPQPNRMQQQKAQIKPVQKQIKQQEKTIIVPQQKIYGNSGGDQQIKTFSKIQQKSFPEPIKRVDEIPEQPKMEKYKVSHVAELIAESKANLKLKPLDVNLLVLDTIRCMKKLSVETLDPYILSCIPKDFEYSLEKQKAKTFGPQIKIGEERQNARFAIPRPASDEELSVLLELQSLKGCMSNLYQSFRQLHMLD